MHEHSDALLKEIMQLVYKSGTVYTVPIGTLWEGLWKQVQSYFIAVTDRFATVVYGVNPYTSKYIGATWSLGKNRADHKLVKRLVKTYGLVNRIGHTVRAQD